MSHPRVETTLGSKLSNAYGVLIDARGKAMDRVHNKHGDWRADDEIGNQQCRRSEGQEAGVNAGHAMPKQQGNVVEEILRVPADIQTDSHAQRITDEQKRVRRKAR